MIENNFQRSAINLAQGATLGCFVNTVIIPDYRLTLKWRSYRRGNALLQFRISTYI